MKMVTFFEEKWLLNELVIWKVIFARSIYSRLKKHRWGTKKIFFFKSIPDKLYKPYTEVFFSTYIKFDVVNKFTLKR